MEPMCVHKFGVHDTTKFVLLLQDILCEKQSWNYRNMETSIEISFIGVDFKSARNRIRDWLNIPERIENDLPSND